MSAAIIIILFLTYLILEDNKISTTAAKQGLLKGRNSLKQKPQIKKIQEFPRKTVKMSRKVLCICLVVKNMIKP